MTAEHNPKQKRDIREEGYIDELISENRVPLFINIKVGNEEKLPDCSSSFNFHDEVMVVVPPVETKTEDQWSGMEMGGTFYMLTPEGNVRGASIYYNILPEEAEKIKTRIDELKPLQVELKMGIKERIARFLHR